MIVPVTEKSIVFAIRRGGERVAQRAAGTRAIRRVDCIVAGALHGDRCRPAAPTTNKLHSVALNNCRFRLFISWRPW
jgi:hypothetical protein